MQYEYAFLVLQLGDAQLYAHTLTLPERSPRMRLTVTVPDPVADEAKRLAEATGRSVSAIVAAAVERHVADERRRLAAERIGSLIGTTPVSPDADEVLREIRQASDRELS